MSLYNLINYKFPQGTDGMAGKTMFLKNYATLILPPHRFSLTLKLKSSIKWETSQKLCSFDCLFHTYKKMRLILLRPNNIPLYVHTPYCLSIYQPVGMCDFQLFVSV